MPRHLSYPSIELFRLAINTVAHRSELAGLAKAPTLKFHGAVKLHGVNSGVALTPEGLHFQSRETILTPEADNAGFARWAEGLRPEFMALLAPLLARAQADAPEGAAPHSIALFGEWFGKGVKRGVGVSAVDKRLAAFGLATIHDGLTRDHGEMVMGEIRTWTPHEELSSLLAPITSTGAILCIEDFPTWEIEIDFSDPASAQAKLAELALAVEAECPVAKALGAPGTGEGIVWTCVTPASEAGFKTEDLRFKVKGEKHSDNATKEIAPIDIEKVESIRACAALVGTPVRFDKGLDHLRAAFPCEAPLHPSKIGPFLKWVAQDVIKEEADTVAANGLDQKEVVKAVNGLAKAWFAQRQAEGAAAQG